MEWEASVTSTFKGYVSFKYLIIWLLAPRKHCVTITNFSFLLVLKEKSFCSVRKPSEVHKGTMWKTCQVAECLSNYTSTYSSHYAIKA